MIEYSGEPVFWADEFRVSVTLRVADESTDSVWRGLFNEQAAASTLDAEAMGNLGLTVIVVRLPKGTQRHAVLAALHELDEITRKTDNGLYARNHPDDEITHAVVEWLRR